jgi:hypothetical protein
VREKLAPTPSVGGGPTPRAWEIGVDHGGDERTVHFCTGCDWHIDTTLMGEERVTRAVHEHLHKDHNAEAPTPLAGAPRETGGLRESLARRIVATVTRMHIVDPWETMEQYHRRMEDVVMGLLAATPPNPHTKDETMLTAMEEAMGTTTRESKP